MSLEFPKPKQTLSAHGLRPKRSFGQNFLCDRSLVEKIARCTGTQPASVVEIGAGLGGLTVCLLELGHRVVALERDRDLIPILQRLQDASAARLTVVEADAKSFDLAACYVQLPPPHVLTGNLPYNLTGPLMRRAVQLAPQLERAVFLVQLEVADRLVAAPASAAYGALSVFTQAAFDVHREFIVRGGAFHPPPQVDSAVVSLLPRQTPVQETPQFRQLVSAAFAQRRKTLRNAWKSVADCSSTELSRAAERAGVSLDARGETLSVDDFFRMSQQLGS